MTLRFGKCHFLLLGVRVTGLEPAHRKTPDPKSGASTNFATRATELRIATAKLLIILQK